MGGYEVSICFTSTTYTYNLPSRELLICEYVSGTSGSTAPSRTLSISELRKSPCFRLSSTISRALANVAVLRLYAIFANFFDDSQRSGMYLRIGNWVASKYEPGDRALTSYHVLAKTISRKVMSEYTPSLWCSGHPVRVSPSPSQYSAQCLPKPRSSPTSALYGHTVSYWREMRRHAVRLTGSRRASPVGPASTD
jgi:hypothetical protein